MYAHCVLPCRPAWQRGLIYLLDQLLCHKIDATEVVTHLAYPQLSKHLEGTSEQPDDLNVLLK